MAGFRSETQAGVRGAFMGIGKIVGVALGAVAVGEIVKSSVSAAASIQKQLEVVRFEFGKASAGLIKFADTTGVALGDSNRSTDEASAKFGLLFKSLGIGHQQAAGMTLGFEKLALSVNAIRGGGASGAATLLQSIVLAAAGNTRGLKQMGIVVDATSEKIAAFKLGLISNMTQALTPAQKTQAIYAIATAHLGQTMALAKKHSGDLANVQARLSAEFMLVKERLGNALLPAMARFVGFLADKLPAAADFLAGVLKDLRVEFQAAFGFIKPLFEPIVRVVRSVVDAFKGGGGLTGALGRLRANFSKLGPASKIAVVALGGIAAAFAAITITSFPITSIIVLGAALAEAYRRSSKFREVVASIGNYIKGTIIPVFERLAHALEPVARFLVDKIGAALTKVVGLFRGSSTGIKIAVVALTVAFGPIIGVIALLATHSQTLRRIMVEAFNAIRSAVIQLLPIFKGIGSAVVSGLQSALPLVHDFGKTVKAVFQDVLPILKTFAKIIGVVVVVAVKVLAAAWKHFGGTIKASVKATFSIVVGIIKGALEVIRGIFDVFIGLLTGNWHKAWKGIKEILGGALHAATSIVKGWGRVLIQFFTDLWHTIEKIVLKGIEKVVHLLAKIPTGFSVFGHHFGFTNPFQGWDASLKNTISNIGKTKKAAIAADAAIRRGAAKGPAKKGGPGDLLIAHAKAQVAALNKQLAGIAREFASASPAIRRAADAKIEAIRRTEAALVASFRRGEITYAQFQKKLGDLHSGAFAKLKTLGQSIGAQVAKGTVDGITGSAPAIQKTLSDTMQRAVAAANTAIQNSVRSAKNNLDKIGQDLAKTITDIQAKLGGAAGALAGSPQGKAFQKLKQLIESGAPAFEIQRARAALSSQLANVGKTTGTGSQIGTQLANLTAEFNKGQIGYKQFQRRLHEILRKDGFTMAQALKAAGPAIADQLRAELRAMAAQAKAIAAVPAKFRGIGGAGGAADIRIVRPLEVIKREQMRVRVVTQKVQQQAKAAAQKQQALQRSFNQVQIAGVGATRQGVAETKGVRGAVGRGASAARAAASHAARSAAAAARVRGHQLVEARRQTALQRKIAGERARMNHEHRQVLRAHRATTRAIQDHHATTRRPPFGPRGLGPPVRSIVRPIIHIQQPTVAVGRLAGLHATIGRLLLPLEQIRGEGLRLQATAVAQLSAVREGFAHLATEGARFDRQIVAAELRSARPLEGLRRDEARYAATAAHQRETLIRSSERQVTLLRKIAKTHHGPPPGHGHTPPGHGSHAARVHAQTGGRG